MTLSLARQHPADEGRPPPAPPVGEGPDGPAEQTWSVLLAACRDGPPPDELARAAAPVLADPDLLAAVAALAADPARTDVGRAATSLLRQAGRGQRGGPLEVLAVRALAAGRGDLAAGLLGAAGADRPPVLVSVHALAW